MAGIMSNFIVVLQSKQMKGQEAVETLDSINGEAVRFLLPE